jgi:S1-C subfamily serine protease
MNLGAMNRTMMNLDTIKWRILCALGLLLAGTVSAQPLPVQNQGTHTLPANYIGHISQSFDSEFVYVMQDLKGEFERRGQREAAGSIEHYLEGGAGTGFVYVAADGANYIITGYRNIALASGLSIRFEGGGVADDRTYTGLSIVAVDEELDIALLAFENGERPFTWGLPLLKRRLWEEETVYSAGFSGGVDAKWQFAEGSISGTYVRIPGARIPGNDKTMQMQGPYIRHNARTDQESPGALLLIAEPGFVTGYAVAGISSSVASQDRVNADQGPAYAIPIDRVEDFLEKALGEKPKEGWVALEERLLAFSRLVGLSSLYRHIAPYLSTSYIAENTAAVIPALNDASGAAIEDIVKAFNHSPAWGINLVVAWTVENRLRNGKAITGIEVDTIEMLGTDLYRTDFHVSGRPDGALWVNEYGMWRILSFDKPAAEHAETTEDTEPVEPEDPAKLRTSYVFTFSVGYGHIFNNIPALTVESAFHVWVLAFGTRIYYGGSPYLRGEGLIGLHFPIRIKNRIGIIPFTGAGIGFVRKDSEYLIGSDGRTTNFDLGISAQGGLRITSSLIPGLFLQGMYQYNYEIFNKARPNPHSLAVSIGYGF